MRFTERRASKRLPVLIDVVIVSGSDKHAAELRDVGSEGVGLVLTTDTVRLKNSASARIELDASCGFPSPLVGTLRIESSPISYHPNIRSAGFYLDPSCRDSLEAIMHECTGASLDGDAQIGFLRAWNMLNITERGILKDFFKWLRALSADGAQIVNNLIGDPNCSAVRLLHLMRVLLRTLHSNEGVFTFSVLKESFEVYRLEHSLEDTQKDKLIKYELGSSRLASV